MGGKCAPPPYFKLLSRTAYINRAVRTVILVVCRPVEVTPLNILSVVLVCVWLCIRFFYSWTSGSLDIKYEYPVNIYSSKLYYILLQFFFVFELLIEAYVFLSQNSRFS